MNKSENFTFYRKKMWFTGIYINFSIQTAIINNNLRLEQEKTRIFSSDNTVSRNCVKWSRSFILMKFFQQDPFKLQTLRYETHSFFFLFPVYLLAWLLCNLVYNVFDIFNQNFAFCLQGCFKTWTLNIDMSATTIIVTDSDC